MKTNKLRVAIAILNWNGKSWLEKFLPGVIQYSSEAEIYVIDNASTDDSIDFVRHTFPLVKIIENASNSGFAAGYNEGLRSIDADVFCLLNSDVEVTEGWIQRVVALFKENPEIAVIQPKILDYNNRNQFEFAGAAGGFLDNLGYPYCRGRLFETVETDLGQYDDEAEIFWASGCCFFILSKDFWAQNGFDERFFAHQEEIDLCWRLQNAGRRIFYTSQSTVYHVGGGTLNKQSARKTFLNIRNNFTMLLKNLPTKAVFPVLLARLILDAAAAVHFGLKMGFPHFLAVIQAHFSFYRQIPGSLKLRKGPQLQKYFNAKFIIFKHFL